MILKTSLVLLILQQTADVPALFLIPISTPSFFLFETPLTLRQDGSFRTSFINRKKLSVKIKLKKGEGGGKK